MDEVELQAAGKTRIAHDPGCSLIQGLGQAHHEHPCRVQGFAPEQSAAVSLPPPGSVISMRLAHTVAGCWSVQGRLMRTVRTVSPRHLLAHW
jgi:hypothetical protein